MRLPGARALPVEAKTPLRRRCASSTELLALPENANRELPRPPQEVAHLIREPVRKSGALTVRIPRTAVEAPLFSQRDPRHKSQEPVKQASPTWVSVNWLNSFSLADIVRPTKSASPRAIASSINSAVYWMCRV